MRILHTADWHLGRLFHGVHLTHDQAGVLDQFVELVGEVTPDVVLIAGDVYDRSVPPPEAVHLLDEVLSRIVLGLHTPVMLIAGNHDSPQRLHFGSRLLAAQGLHVAGNYTAEIPQLVLHDDAGPVHFYAVPYAEPAVVRGALDEEVHNHDTAMRAVVQRVRAGHPRNTRAVLLAHACVTGGVLSEDSERPLSIGGTGTVEVDCFDGFDFVALGHLHRMQTPDHAHLHYAGSLMKYSFAEAAHVKSVSLIEMDESGHSAVQQFSFTPRHEVRCIAGYLNELLANPPDGNRDDYLQVTLLDHGAILDAMGRLREVYPNVLDIQRAGLLATGEMSGPRSDHRKLETAELFAGFFAQVTGEEPTEEQREAFAAVVNRLREREREVPACAPSR